jgi:hypothetical protein
LLSSKQFKKVLIFRRYSLIESSIENIKYYIVGNKLRW